MFDLSFSFSKIKFSGVSAVSLVKNNTWIIEHSQAKFGSHARNWSRIPSCII